MMSPAQIRSTDESTKERASEHEGAAQVTTASQRADKENANESNGLMPAHLALCKSTRVCLCRPPCGADRARRVRRMRHRPPLQQCRVRRCCSIGSPYQKTAAQQCSRARPSPTCTHPTMANGNATVTASDPLDGGGGEQCSAVCARLHSPCRLHMPGMRGCCSPRILGTAPVARRARR